MISLVSQSRGRDLISFVSVNYIILHTHCYTSNTKDEEIVKKNCK